MLLRNFDICAFLCRVPVDDEIRSMKTKKLLGALEDLQVPLLGKEGILCQNWAEVSESCRLEEININFTAHPVLWRYIPELDTYYNFGIYTEGVFKRIENYKGLANSGQAGLLLSFFRACRDFLNSTYEYMLFLEDDASLAFDFRRDFCDLMESSLPNFDFIRLVSEDKIEVVKSEFQMSHKFLCYPYSASFTQIVLASRAGAQKFLEWILVNGLVFPLDWVIYNIRSEIARTPTFISYFVDPSKLNLGTVDGGFRNESIIDKSSKARQYID